MKFGIHYSLGVGMNPTMDDYVRVAVKGPKNSAITQPGWATTLSSQKKLNLPIRIRLMAQPAFLGACPFQIPLSSWQPWALRQKPSNSAPA